MTTHTQLSEADRAKQQATTQSHRWMVHLLAEMVQYSEAHELDRVTSPLMEAIEKIAPYFAVVDKASEDVDTKPRIMAEKDNVITFAKRSL